MSSLRPGTVDYSKWDNFSSDGSTNSDDKDGDRKIHKEEADENDGEDSGDEGDEESGDEDISQSPVRGNDNFHRPVASTPNATRASSSANPITPQVRFGPVLGGAPISVAYEIYGRRPRRKCDHCCTGPPRKEAESRAKIGTLESLCCLRCPQPKISLFAL